MLSVDKVSFTFGSEAVLADVNVHCNAGETIAITGVSGVGKTTLCNLIAGILDLQGGAISINGIGPSAATRRGQVGYIFQTPTLMPWLTVRENVCLAFQLTQQGTRSSGRATHEQVHTMDTSVDQALKAAHIEHAANKYPHELSGGMQTRASIARAISYRPSLLIADEPFAQLDDLVKELLYQDFQRMTSVTQMSTVIVTHNLSEAILLADRIYVLGKRSPHEPAGIVRCEHVLLGRPRESSDLADGSVGLMRRLLFESLGASK